MAFLDWISNRHTSEPRDISQKQQVIKSEAALAQFRREGAGQHDQPKPAGQIPEADKAAVKSIRQRIGLVRPAANAQQQTAETARKQAKPDRILESLERAPGSRLSPTPDQKTDGIDQQRLARAERFVDASSRPKRQEPPPMRWPRQRGSWER